MKSADGFRGADRVPARDEPGEPAPPETAEQGGRRYWAERLGRAERPAGSLAALRERAGQLPPGHPSSLWDERGRPRPPASRPADFELPDYA